MILFDLFFWICVGEDSGCNTTTSTPAQLGALIRSDLVRWKKVVTDAKIQHD